MKKVVSLLGIFVLGIIGGIGLIVFISILPFRFDHPINHLLGIKKPQIVGFLPFWLLDRAQDSYPDLTTLTYFGLTLDRDGTVVKLLTPQEEEPGWTTFRGERLGEKVNEAKKRGQKLSLLIHSSRESTISALLEDPVLHARNLVHDLAPFMREKGFTDVNLDLETFKEASESEQEAFTQFVTEVKREIDKSNVGTLTIEISPYALINNYVINPNHMGEVADYIVLMAYDFFYKGSYLAGHSAPLGGGGEVRDFDVEMAINEALKIIPKEKLILGIPLYGYEWETLHQTKGNPVIPGTGATASNRRIQELLGNCPDCQVQFDAVTKSPYVIRPEGEYFRQIFYEDEMSLAEKLTLAKTYELQGIALWALGYEGERMLDPIKDYKRVVRF